MLPKRKDFCFKSRESHDIHISTNRNQVEVCRLFVNQGHEGRFQPETTVECDSIKLWACKKQANYFYWWTDFGQLACRQFNQQTYLMLQSWTTKCNCQSVCSTWISVLNELVWDDRDERLSQAVPCKLLLWLSRPQWFPGVLVESNKNNRHVIYLHFWSRFRMGD